MWTENLQKVSFPAGRFWHSKKIKTTLVKAKLEVRESFPSPMQRNIPPQKRGVMSECSATLVLQDITADTGEGHHSRTRDQRRDLHEEGEEKYLERRR